MNVEPTDWFRIRHRNPFSAEAIAAFRAACAVYRAKTEAILEHWAELPAMRSSPRPTVRFFEPEVSDDGRVLSLAVRVEHRTLSARALLQSTATRELHQYLPFPLVAEVEVGVTEPALEGAGWRNDWWNPNRDNSITGDEAARRLGFSLEKDAQHPGVARLVPGWRRRLQWLISSYRRQ